jgi:hypothetical protein
MGPHRQGDPRPRSLRSAEAVARQQAEYRRYPGQIERAQTRTEEKEAGLPRAIIEKFQVIDGKAVVENLSGKEPIREELAPISFTVENLSTLEGRQGEYRFSGCGPYGRAI